MHIKIIDLLTKVAETSREHQKLACAIVHKKRILAFGINSDKTDPFQSNFSDRAERIYKHAEIDAIKRAHNKFGKEILKHCTLYVVRIKRPYVRSKQWIWGMARPCSGCMKAIEEYNIRKVIYTTDSGYEKL
jgi:tRNA(Arg) A34 adenosine deaminase TadA